MWRRPYHLHSIGAGPACLRSGRGECCFYICDRGMASKSVIPYGAVASVAGEYGYLCVKLMCHALRLVLSGRTCRFVGMKRRNSMPLKNIVLSAASANVIRRGRPVMTRSTGDDNAKPRDGASCCISGIPNIIKESISINTRISASPRGAGAGDGVANR